MDCDFKAKFKFLNNWIGESQNNISIGYSNRSIIFFINTQESKQFHHSDSCNQMLKAIQENIETSIEQNNLTLLNQYLAKIPIFAQLKQNFEEFSETKRYNSANSRRFSSNRLLFDMQSIEPKFTHVSSSTNKPSKNDEVCQQKEDSDARCYDSSAYYQFLKKIRVISLLNQPYELKNQTLYTFFGKGNIMSKRLFLDYGATFSNRGNSPVSPILSNFFSDNSGISKILTINSKFKRLSASRISNKVNTKKLLKRDSNRQKQSDNSQCDSDSRRVKIQQLENSQANKIFLTSELPKQDQIKENKQIKGIGARNNLRKGTMAKTKNKTINSPVSKQSYQLKSFEIIDQNSFYSAVTPNNISGSNILTNVFGITPFSLVIPSPDQACMLLQISSSQINQSMMNFLREKYNEKIKFLMGFSVFDDISKGKIQAQSHHFKFTKYKFNQILYTNVKQGKTIIQHQNSQSQHSTEIQKMINEVLLHTLQNPTNSGEKIVYFIHKGQIEITIDYSLGFTSKKASYIVKGPNIIFSEGYVFQNFKNQQIMQSYQKIETAKCITEKCICYKIERQKLQQIIKSCFKYPQSQNQQKTGQLCQSQRIQNLKIPGINNNKKLSSSANISRGGKESPNHLNSKSSYQQGISTILDQTKMNLFCQRGDATNTITTIKNQNLQQLNILTNNRNHYHSKTTAALQCDFQHAEKCLQKIKNQDTHDKYRRKQIKINKLTNYQHLFNQTAASFHSMKAKDLKQSSLDLSSRAFKIKEHFSNSLNQKYGMFAQKKIAFLINKKNNKVKLSPSPKNRVQSVIQYSNNNNSQSQLIVSQDSQSSLKRHPITTQDRRVLKSQLQKDGQSNQERKQDFRLSKLVQYSSTPILYEIKQLHPSSPEMSKINAKLKQVRLGKIKKMKENLINSRQSILLNRPNYQCQYQSKQNNTNQQHNYKQQTQAQYLTIDNQIRNHVTKFLMKSYLRKKGKGGHVLVSYMRNSQLKRNQINRQFQPSVRTPTLHR